MIKGTINNKLIQTPFLKGLKHLVTPKNEWNIEATEDLFSLYTIKLWVTAMQLNKLTFILLIFVIVFVSYLK